MGSDENADTGDGKKEEADALDDIDVHALLSAVVDKPPPDDLSERVTSRLALAETVAELARLFGLVPAKVASDAVSKDDPAPEDDGGEEDDDE